MAPEDLDQHTVQVDGLGDVPAERDHDEVVPQEVGDATAPALVRDVLREVQGQVE